ncbi:hypothetical protein BDV28DRAFT_68653 [Aspergillus coremiiformis]|uniref:Uncharacterized protein n=1 Tax=Aspergillus coremiiformis TaxID=138285 RepID=A0A5N6YW21_9EURO|nr:hypothetical protein BDV28DRAFT_68653 [Aspergillus coremiiformis]
MGYEKVAFWLCCNARCWFSCGYFTSNLHHWKLFPFFYDCAVYWMWSFVVPCLLFFFFISHFEKLYSTVSNVRSLQGACD